MFFLVYFNKLECFILSTKYDSTQMSGVFQAISESKYLHFEKWASVYILEK